MAYLVLDVCLFSIEQCTIGFADSAPPCERTIYVVSKESIVFFCPNQYVI
jgi:hypothetical protein